MLTELFQKRSLENPNTPINSSTVCTAVGGSLAGETVTERTAITTTAVWAAVNLLAGAVGQLPVEIFQRDGSKRIARPGHSLSLMLKSPNDLMTSQVFTETMVTNLMLWGKAFALIVRDGNAIPLELLPMPSEITHLERINGVTKVVLQSASGQFRFNPIDVIYIPGLTFDGIAGLSPIRTTAQTTGITLAAETFASSFYGNGATLGGILEHPGVMGEEAMVRFRESWEKMYAGRGNAHKTAILEEGMKYNVIGVEPDKAQFLQTRQFQIAEVARIFGVPPHMLADLDKATFSNIEQQTISFVTYSLNRWIVRFEQEYNRKLFREDEKQTHFVKLNLKGLLRGDNESRTNGYVKGTTNGWLSINDVRALEDLNPIGPEGDVYRVPLNMAPASTDQGDGDGQTNDPVADPDEGRSLHQGYTDWLDDVTRQVIERETQNLQRAVKKLLITRDGGGNVAGRPALIDWVGTFYASHEDHLRRLIGPVVASVGCDSTVLGKIAEAHTRCSVETVRTRIESASDEWLVDTLTDLTSTWLDTRSVALADMAVKIIESNRAD